MTDWIDDLEKLAALYQGPDQYKKQEAAAIVFGFVAPVADHLSAAAQLLTDRAFGDIFVELEHKLEERARTKQSG
ncbi:MAG: hypothetical protein ACK4RK_15600 [Gemmataceae bacterium]